MSALAETTYEDVQRVMDALDAFFLEVTIKTIVFVVISFALICVIEAIRFAWDEKHKWDEWEKKP